MSNGVAVPTVTATPSRVREGHNSTYTISLSANAPDNLRMGFLMSGTATIGTDYTLSGTG
ncbi:MAG TPA: hypothetical protein VFQ78_08645 [Candidatus Udaeobacter sp.]|nr:hypothetical protein [Candidatus Udaeobacter sp.]